MNVFPELKGAALVRELHVYGTIVPTYDDTEKEVLHPPSVCSIALLWVSRL